MSVNALRVHVSLNVSDVARSIDFYRRMFGSEPVRVRPGYAKFDIADPPINLALNEVEAPTARTSHHDGALSHLGIQVESTDDVLKTRLRWIESGLLTRDEMETECCYARQDKTWVNDPDGNEWEVFVVLGESDKMTTAEGTCCVSSAEPAVAGDTATPSCSSKAVEAAAIESTAATESCCIDADGGEPAVTGKECACACAS